jgi:hypothetical protein
MKWLTENFRFVCYVYIMVVAGGIDDWQTRTCIMVLMFVLWDKKND